MRTIAVAEGWAGGPKLSRLFTDELAKNGFRIVKDKRQADVIFAHSTACYKLPVATKAQLILLLDPPYWPGRSIIGRWIDLLKNGTKPPNQSFKQLLTKKLWETYYILVKPSYTWSVLRNQSKLEFLEKLKSENVLLVRNQRDQFCSSSIKDLISGIKYVELPGDHEDYYSNPKPYIDLIQKELA